MLRRFQILLRFSTFALRLQPFASLFGKGAYVCSENDTFFLRKGGVSFSNGAYVCSEKQSFFFGFPRFRKLCFSLQRSCVRRAEAECGRERRRLAGIRAGDPNGTLFEPLLEPYRGTLC